MPFCGKKNRTNSTALKQYVWLIFHKILGRGFHSKMNPYSGLDSDLTCVALVLVAENSFRIRAAEV